MSEATWWRSWEAKQRKRQKGPRTVPDEIRATLVDHILNHGLAMAEAGQRVQPNFGRTTVSSIIQTFCQQNRYVI